MPLSSVTIVGFVTLAIRYLAQRLEIPRKATPETTLTMNPILQKVA